MEDMGLYEVALSMPLLGFGMGTMLANFHISGILLVLRAVFNMLVRECESNEGICVSYVISLYLCVALLMDLFVLCVACFDGCL